MRYSTACFVTLDPATGVVYHASAGHPPILLVDPRRGSRYLEGGLSWPLCAASGQRGPHGTALLDPGATLVLYSDGLIERRGEPIDVGLERLAAAADRSSALDPEELCHALVDDLVEGQRIQDDVVVVGVRRLTTRALLELSLPGGLEAPAAARKALSSLTAHFTSSAPSA